MSVMFIIYALNRLLTIHRYGKKPDVECTGIVPGNAASITDTLELTGLLNDAEDAVYK